MKFWFAAKGSFRRALLTDLVRDGVTEPKGRERSFSTSKILLASIVVASIGLGGTVSTGAYFAASRTVASNKLNAATVTLGNLADNPSVTTPLSFQNLIPLSDSVAASKARTFKINVRNTGTAAIDWVARFSPNQTSSLPYSVRIQYTLDGGATWSTPQSLASLAGGSVSSTSSLAAGNSLAVGVRMWLSVDADNSTQKTSATFDLTVSAVQSGAPR